MQQLYQQLLHVETVFVFFEQKTSNTKSEFKKQVSLVSDITTFQLLLFVRKRGYLLCLLKSVTPSIIKKVQSKSFLYVQYLKLFSC